MHSEKWKFKTHSHHHHLHHDHHHDQELLTRLAPLPLTSLGVREVSLAQPEEAEGLGSVEVIDHDNCED